MKGELVPALGTEEVEDSTNARFAAGNPIGAWRRV